MSDLLSVALGVVLGVLASVPVALVIAASTAGPRARRDDRPPLDVPYVELPVTSECQHENQGIYVGSYGPRGAWFVICEDCGATLKIQSDDNKPERQFLQSPMLPKVTPCQE